MPKERLDILVVEGGLAESREKARRLVQAGQVRVAGQVQTKAGHQFDTGLDVTVDALPRFVSRGGDKLEHAFKVFRPDVTGSRCLDIGASTGGFTDCLLQHGAAQVFAVDVGRGQLHWKLRQDQRVAVLEKVNARYLEEEDLPRDLDFCTADVSFISLTLILPVAKIHLRAGAGIVVLIKPQFEAGREHVEKGGVVRSDEVRAAVVERIRAFGCDELGLEWVGVTESPLKGPAGNIEFLAHWRVPEENS